VIVTRVISGNAVASYVVVGRESFHTDFAARLYGWLMCEGRPNYHYWVIE
jgi:hypothetical protein